MNHWCGMGRLTKDPEIRWAQGKDGQFCVARYTVAIDKRGKDAGTNFIQCKALGKNGEFAEKYLKKGMKIGIEGEIETGSYDHKDGYKVYTTEILVCRHEFCESKGDSQGAPQSDAWVNIPDGIDEELPFN